MKITNADDSDLDLSKDGALLIGALVDAVEHDEFLASCLIDWGVAVCLKLGLDPASLVKQSRRDLLLLAERETAGQPPETGNVH